MEIEEIKKTNFATSNCTGGLYAEIEVFVGFFSIDLLL
jgi:hypothetical protein